MIIIGIDPGLHGAIATLKGDTLSIDDIPTLDIGVGRTAGGAKKAKLVIDEIALANLIDEIAGSGPATIWLEQVGVRPGEGAVGAFSFGRTYGLLRGMAAAHFLPIRDVTPQVWKKAMGVKGDKDQSRLRASALRPADAHLWPLKKHDGRAEAALIALYGASRPT